jgi:hypothetical protein
MMMTINHTSNDEVTLLLFFLFLLLDWTKKKEEGNVGEKRKPKNEKREKP